MLPGDGRARLPRRGDLRRRASAHRRRPLPVPADPRRDGPAPDQRGAPRAALGRSWAPACTTTSRRWASRSPGRRSRSGPRPRGRSGSRRTSTAGTAASTRCASWASRACGSCSCPASARATPTSTSCWAPTASGARRPTRWRSGPRCRRTRRRGCSSRRHQWGDDDWMSSRAEQAARPGADVDLRDAPRLVAARQDLGAAGRGAAGVPLRPGVHPRRADAGDAAPVRRLVGLPRHVVLRAGLAVRRPRRLPAAGRPAAPGRHRRDPRLGARATSPPTSGRWCASTGRPSTRTRTHSAAGTRSGARTSSTSAATRCATSSTPTRSTGSRSSTPTGCASTAWPRCSTSTTRARRASGRRTSTAAARTSRRCSSSRR